MLQGGGNSPLPTDQSLFRTSTVYDIGHCLPHCAGVDQGLIRNLFSFIVSGEFGDPRCYRFQNSLAQYCVRTCRQLLASSYSFYHLKPPWQPTRINSAMSALFFSIAGSMMGRGADDR
jgi:hypothetical protein